MDGAPQALALPATQGTRYCEADALVGPAAAYRRLGQRREALAHAQQALTISRQAGYRILEGRGQTIKTAIYLDDHDHKQGAKHAAKAIDIQRKTGHRLGLARSLRVLGDALRDTNRSAATTYWQEATDLLTDIGTPEQ